MRHRVEIYEAGFEPTTKQRRWGGVLPVVGVLGSIVVSQMGLNLMLAVGFLLLSVVGFLLAYGRDAKFCWFRDEAK